MIKNKVKIEEAIQNQILYIKNSCQLFDSNNCQIEAIRVATSIRILLKELLKGAIPDIKLMSTIPKVRKVNLDRLISTVCSNFIEVKNEIDKYRKAILNEGNFLLIYIKEKMDWYLYAVDSKGNEISCIISELSSNLHCKVKHEKLLLTHIMKGYQEKIDEIHQQTVIEHLDALLGYDSYAPSLFFPMIKNTDFASSLPILGTDIYRMIDVDEWENEIIFSITGSMDRQRHTLSRGELLWAARSHDGGAHFNFGAEINYRKAKYGEILGTYNGKDVTTKNYHLIMLRQLGHEVLSSPFVAAYSK